MLIIVGGVSGCGKSSVGKELQKTLSASKVSCKFIEGDAYHPSENIEKMKNGIPLQDEDRVPWLLALSDICKKEAENNSIIILSCSALKKKYREILARGNKQTLFIHLAGSFELVSQRFQARKNHFMPQTLLQSQFECLEDPKKDLNFTMYRVLEVNIDQSIDNIITSILDFLKHDNSCMVSLF